MKVSSHVTTSVSHLGPCNSNMASICFAHLTLSILCAPVRKWGTHFVHIFFRLGSSWIIWWKVTDFNNFLKWEMWVTCLTNSMAFSLMAVFDAPDHGSSPRCFLPLWKCRIHRQTVSNEQEDVPHTDYNSWWRGLSPSFMHVNLQILFFRLHDFCHVFIWCLCDIIITRWCKFIWSNWGNIKVERINFDLIYNLSIKYS